MVSTILMTEQAEIRARDFERLRAVGDGVMSVAEAWEFLGVSRASLCRLMDQGEIPSFKVGRWRLIPRRALLDFMVSRL